MLIDAMMALFAADPVLFLPGFIGAEDGVRLRMLRLARAAIIALLLLTLLYQDLADDGGAHGRLVRGGKLLLVIGAVGMPLTLCLAVFTWLGLKTFLAVPAVAIFAGVLAGIWLASRLKRPSEVWGWLLIAIAMAAGLFMGTYAFDGPSPTPDFLGAYNAFNRRLSRLAHGYAIILGLLSILLARELNAARIPSWPRRLGRVLVVAGSIVTVAGVLLQAIGAPPLPTLCVGPALVASGMVLCLLRSTFVKMDQPRP
jgi:hypothetical protein